MTVQAKLVFVPPGGGEKDYELDFELPEIPKAGDYLVITRPDENGTEDFIVRRTWWSLLYPKKDNIGGVMTIIVECEFAIGHSSSDSHKEACEIYKNKTGQLNEFENSIY